MRREKLAEKMNPVPKNEAYLTPMSPACVLPVLVDVNKSKKGRSFGVTVVEKLGLDPGSNKGVRIIVSGRQTLDERIQSFCYTNQDCMTIKCSY